MSENKKGPQKVLQTPGMEDIRGRCNPKRVPGMGKSVKISLLVGGLLELRLEGWSLPWDRRRRVPRSC